MKMPRTYKINRLALVVPMMAALSGLLCSMALGLPPSFEAVSGTNAGKRFAELKAKALKGHDPDSLPKTINLGEKLSAIEKTDWVEGEGVVTFAGRMPDATMLEVDIHGDRLALHLLSSVPAELSGLLHRNIHFEGVAQAGYGMDGNPMYCRVWIGSLDTFGEQNQWASPLLSTAHQRAFFEASGRSVAERFDYDYSEK